MIEYENSFPYDALTQWRDLYLVSIGESGMNEVQNVCQFSVHEDESPAELEILLSHRILDQMVLGWIRDADTVLVLYDTIEIVHHNNPPVIVLVLGVLPNHPATKKKNPKEEMSRPINIIPSQIVELLGYLQDDDIIKDIIEYQVHGDTKQYTKKRKESGMLGRIGRMLNPFTDNLRRQQSLEHFIDSRFSYKMSRSEKRCWIEAYKLFELRSDLNRPTFKMFNKF